MPIEIGVYPSSLASENHLAGSVAAGRGVYDDLNAYTWYRGAWLTINRGQRGLSRTLHGSEDAPQETSR